MPKRRFCGGVIKYQAAISILPSPLRTFRAQKIHLEDVVDVKSFTLRSFRHIATIHGCMFYLSLFIISGMYEVMKYLKQQEKFSAVKVEVKFVYVQLMH